MEVLLRIAEEHGIDVEELIMNTIRDSVNDSTSTIRLRVELAENTYDAMNQLNKGDAV
ncbi:hypothetical protein [Caldivirga sp.]|uniref:hypothetical protein n=1 Tax=Caldivirga sp. TaxID=2080243 RepID=UPI003D143637